jgi:hypothetical protein
MDRQLGIAIAALEAIRDRNCPPGCTDPGPWDQHDHPRAEIMARDALREITGRIEPESVWGDGTGGPASHARGRKHA